MRKRMIMTNNKGKVMEVFDVVYCVNCGCYLESVEDKCENCKRFYDSLLLSKDVKGGIKKERK